MVRTQMMSRDITDPLVLEAMRTVPRHVFVPEALRQRAYQDGPLPIGYDQTISQPYIVAFMIQQLALTPDARVLEIGTGSGYETAVCAEIAQAVYSLEIIPDLADAARTCLQALGYDNVEITTGDGYFGHAAQGPFDAIIGSAAAVKTPEPLIVQLKPGGRMVLPRTYRAGVQSLVLISKTPTGKIIEEDILAVRFVPMTGKVTRD